MQLREKGSKGDPVSMDWDQAQAALRTGNYEIVSDSLNDAGEKSEKIVADLGEEPDLDAMTKAELEAHAAEKRIDLGDAKTKADILEVVKKAAG